MALKNPLFILYTNLDIRKIKNIPKTIHKNMFTSYHQKRKRMCKNYNIHLRMIRQSPHSNIVCRLCNSRRLELRKGMQI